MSEVLPAIMYRHSGRVPIGGLILTLGIMVPVAMVLGILYSGAVVYLPYIKLRGVVTFVYAAILGASVGAICYQAKFRSHFKVAAMTIFITSLSFYSAWAVHCAWVMSWQEGLNGDVFMAAVLGFNPNFIIEWGKHIFDNGIWMQNGKPTTGWHAAFGWIVEALVVFMTAFMTRRTYGNSPFCEPCNRWTEETKQLAELPVSPADPAWQQVASGQIESMKRLQLDQNNPQYVELQLALCPSCDRSDFLSAVAVTMTLNKEGEWIKQETDIFRHMCITSTQKAEILVFAQAMAEAVRVMADDDQADDEQADDEQTE